MVDEIDKMIEEKKKILLEYFNDLGLEYNNIILFLFYRF